MCPEAVSSPGVPQQPKRDFSWVKDLVVPILAAVIALPVGIGVEKYKTDAAREELEHSQHQVECAQNAVYLDSMALALGGMIDDFQKHQNPRENGREFNLMLDALGKRGSPELGSNEWNSLIDPLRKVANDAQNVDLIFGHYYRDSAGRSELEAWINDASRAKGELRAEAAKMRADLDSCRLK